MNKRKVNVVIVKNPKKITPTQDHNPTTTLTFFRIQTGNGRNQQVHPVVKKYTTKIDINDKGCTSEDYIYNIFYNPQIHPNNTWEIDDHLKMIGGNIDDEDWKIAINKTNNIIQSLKTNNDLFKNAKKSYDEILKNIPNYANNIIIIKLDDGFYYPYCYDSNIKYIVDHK